MTLQEDTSARVFRVIEGGGSKPAGTAIPLPPEPQVTAEELAAEMGVLFALSLAQDLPLRRLHDPHAVLAGLGGEPVSLHDLLCELRCLRWYDSETELSPQAWAASSPARHGEQDRRRALNWNDDGQLTLRTLLRGPVALRGPAASPSAAWQMGTRTHPDQAAALPPGDGASVAQWAGWCATARGAAAQTERAGCDTANTLRDLSHRAQAMPASRPFYSLALTALASATPPDDGPACCGLWDGGRLMALLSRAETQAEQLGRQRARQVFRLTRPAVVAARFTVGLANEERGTPDTTAEAARALADAAPRLLDWIGIRNAADRGPQRFARSLFLPLCAPGDVPPNPADLAAHMLVAGAMATLLKAVLDTGPLRDAERGGATRPLGGELDRLCSDMALARCVAATHFPAENHADLRTGEALALALLRDALERDNRETRLSLHDFDGTRLELRCNRRQFGRGHAVLHRNGRPIPWPLTGTDRAAHLAAVN